MPYLTVLMSALIPAPGPAWCLLFLLLSLDVSDSGAASLAATPPGGPGCPRGCSCMWRKGKETVICRDAAFTEIPGIINTNTQVSLSLSLSVTDCDVII